MNEAIKKEFETAYQEYAKLILKHVYFRIGDWHQAEDLMQETFCKTWQYLMDDKEIKTLKNFLYVVSNNLIADYYKSKAKSPQYLEDVPEKEMAYKPTTQKEIDENMIIEEFRCYVEELKENYKKIFIYRYFEYMSVKEIAVITNKSPNYVSVALHRGKRIIQKKYMVAKNKDSLFKIYKETKGLELS